MLLFSLSFNSKLFNILSELFENEKNYVQTLEKGIVNYMNALDQKDLPKPLRGQKFHIFANIVGIYNFHRNEFLPSLLACDEDDPIQVAEVFTHYITKDYFYSYVIYAMNRKRSELLCNQCMDFWRVSIDLAQNKNMLNMNDDVNFSFSIVGDSKRMRRPARNQFIPSPADTASSALQTFVK